MIYAQIHVADLCSAALSILAAEQAEAKPSPIFMLPMRAILECSILCPQPSPLPLPFPQLQSCCSYAVSAEQQLRN